MLLHTAKYSHKAVNGVLLGEELDGHVLVLDAVPLFHICPGLAPKTFSVKWNTSKTSENLSESIHRLEAHLPTQEGKARAKLAGVLAVAKSLKNYFPILKTQAASSIYKQRVKEFIGGEDKPDVRSVSSEMYELLSRHLNIMHIYIKGTAFIMEHRESGPLVRFLERMTNMVDSSYSFTTDLNKHIENKIGDMYKSVLGYMDTERDRNAMNYILTKITSVSSMARLQNTQNKSALQRCRDTVPLQLRKFERIRQDIRTAMIHYPQIALGTRNVSVGRFVDLN